MQFRVYQEHYRSAAMRRRNAKYVRISLCPPAQNFAARKHLIEYDDVMNKQRKAVYGMRRALLEGKDQKERNLEIIDGIVASFIDARCPERAGPRGPPRR